MKKILAVMLTLTLTLALAACGGKNNDTAGEPDGSIQTPAEPSPAPTPTPDPAPEPPAGQGEEPKVPEQSPDASEETQTPEESGEDDAAVERISHEDVTLRAAGDSFRLTVWDSNGNAPDACTFTSADPAIAEVDEAGGEVTAVAPGTTTVTAHVKFGDKETDFSCIVRCVWKAEPVSGSGEDVVQPPAEETAPPAGESLPSLSGFFATLQGSYEGLGAMSVMEGEVLDNYYPGLSSHPAVEEALIQETMMSMSNVAVGLVKFTDEATLDDMLEVQAILQGRINAQAEGGAWYPASCETWKAGVITSVSRHMGMFVYPDEAQTLADLFTQTFSN